MAIAKITDAARDAASVGAMADRPNSTARDGYSGLTPEQVKAKFDALPFINTAKINELIDAVNAGTGGTGDYADLTNKPKINNVTLSGSKSLSDIGAESRGKITISGVEYDVTRKALVITDGGVTTTYYVADIS